MPNISRLFADHDEIASRAQSLLQLLDKPVRRSVVPERLAELADTIARHVQYEQDIVYPEVVPHPSGELSDAAREFESEFVALRGDWVRYLEDWPPAEIDGGWERFATATRDILPRMLARIRREEACLYPLALHRGALTLR